MIIRKCWPFLICFVLTASSLLSGRDVRIVSSPDPETICYELAEYLIEVEGQWENPYRSEDVWLEAEWLTPSGKVIRIPGFWDRDLGLDRSLWRVRYTPVESGVHSGVIILGELGNEYRLDECLLTVGESQKKGFLHSGDAWVLRYSDGTPFRGVGQNFCWESRSDDDSKYFRELHENPAFNYDNLLGKMAENGGSFFRTWMCAWNLPLEWKSVIQTIRYENDSDWFNRSAIHRMDYLVRLCDRLGIHMMLTLDHAGSYLNDQWGLNSYNIRHGGPVSRASAFFSDPAAKAQYRDRLRYLVGRWGYSPSIAVWEFFNEVDHIAFHAADPVEDSVIVEWHREMSRYLANIDPYDRLISTSVSHRDIEGLNDIPSIDINQRHMYGNVDHIASTVVRYNEAHGKPYVIGEFGYEWDWSKNFDDFGHLMDRDYRHGLWLGLFSPTPILPMTWWWEYFDQRNMTRFIQPVSLVNRLMLDAGRGDFNKIPIEVKDGLVLSVRCGKKIFVYFANRGQTTLSCDLLLSDVERGKWEVQRVDTHTGVVGEAEIVTFKEGGNAIATGSIPLGEDAVWILTPFPGN